MTATASSAVADVTADDWRRRLEASAENHLRDLIKATIHVDTQTSIDGHSLPYCSCITCEVRHAIAGAWPVIQQMIAEAVEQHSGPDDPDPVCLNPRAVDGTAAPCGVCAACRRVEL